MLINLVMILRHPAERLANKSRLNKDWIWQIQEKPQTIMCNKLNRKYMIGPGRGRTKKNANSGRIKNCWSAADVWIEGRNKTYYGMLQRLQTVGLVLNSWIEKRENKRNCVKRENRESSWELWEKIERELFEKFSLKRISFLLHNSMWVFVPVARYETPEIRTNSVMEKLTTPESLILVRVSLKSLTVLSVAEKERRAKFSIRNSGSNIETWSEETWRRNSN